MTQSSSSSMSSWTDNGKISNHASHYHSNGSNKKRPSSSPKQQRTKRRLVNGGATTTKPANHAVASAAATAAVLARSKSVDFTAFDNNSKEWFAAVATANASPSADHSSRDDADADSGHSSHNRNQKELNTEQHVEEAFPEINDVDWDIARHNPSAVPRRQKLRYDGDEYTPKWVRYTGQLKEGYCDSCKLGKWLQLKNSAYWYHKQFFHGISSVSGKRFLEPLEQRAGDHDVVEGLCHQCQQFVSICNAKRKTSVLWYRHAHKASSTKPATIAYQ
ncbi:hypothetical protein BDB00DRAFT_795026 [Zychaea mexicana]|uniref:uncharacterized protein n=1 Tax=Zychaea mexicana TaxID=64656 RepID=UPI0022FE09D7|nr:uncharacterized protein BDB00DRAFT_795026 [Zychaea mexicana]KAI9499661.1 hypothetical protein BDB00DRAFT_795026 [Zychaea mexicana]